MWSRPHRGWCPRVLCPPPSSQSLTALWQITYLKNRSTHETAHKFIKIKFSPYFVFKGKPTGVLKRQFLYYFEEVKERMAVFGVSVVTEGWLGICPISFFTHYFYIFIECTHPILVHQCITMWFRSVISHLLSMPKIICSRSWLESRTKMLVCVWRSTHWDDFQLSFINPEGAHAKPGRWLLSSVCFILSRGSATPSPKKHSVNRRQNTSMCTCPSCKSVCVFCILVELLSSLNRFSLLLFRLIQRHRLCPAHRLSGRSETRGSPL